MYDALVYAYTLDDKLDDAFRFLHKISSQEPNTPDSNKHWLRHPTLFALIECCFKHADERAWWLIDEAKSKGVEIGRERVLEWVDLARRMEKEREEVKQNSADGPDQDGEKKSPTDTQDDTVDPGLARMDSSSL